ncbi:RNA-binding protein [Marinococcus halophilus]|uniref:RNA-binding protein n=1 Tax=Marinococcus halophilus TaxID=1371 RepID=A0A510YCR1_MARHA|nr:ASCH domain-containing protein [Marinococcus halophilus]OZT80507.1 RNA-binding protein [Marinococcus halophilus]GEK60147.1 RNA-binding protein [Marinococcus halophilus]
MNQAADTYWKHFWQQRNEAPPEQVTAWSFGVDPDELAELVVSGVKTATCSAYMFYEIENEPLPSIGDYSIILNKAGDPVCIIQTTSVKIMPMNEVPEEFAEAEGEGDRSYEYWWNAHEQFFTEALEEVGEIFREDMTVVCERFEVVK